MIGRNEPTRPSGQWVHMIYVIKDAGRMGKTYFTQNDKKHIVFRILSKIWFSLLWNLFFKTVSLFVSRTLRKLLVFMKIRKEIELSLKLFFSKILLLKSNLMRKTWMNTIGGVVVVLAAVIIIHKGELGQRWWGVVQWVGGTWSRVITIDYCNGYFFIN